MGIPGCPEQPPGEKKEPATGDIVTLEELFAKMEKLLWNKKAVSEVAEVLLQTFQITWR